MTEINKHLEVLIDIIQSFSKTEITETRAGSVKWLLFGPEKSRQSISIKLGKIIGETFTKMLIKGKGKFKLLECGILKLQNCNKKKDFDLIWVDYENNIVYYRECKGNMELDTEKLPATIDKIKKLTLDLQLKYPQFKVNAGILNWSIYERRDAVGGLNQINKCEKENIKVDHFKDFIIILSYIWSKKDFYDYFRKIGTIMC